MLSSKKKIYKLKFKP